jgi:hypothetical protein
MHDQRIGRRIGQLLFVEPEEVEIFAGARRQRAGHALALQAQHHDDVSALKSAPHVVKHLDAQPRQTVRRKRRRPDDAHPRAKRAKQQNV